MPSYFSFFVSLSLASQALSLAISPRNILYGRSNSGEATYYGGNVSGGHCSFSTYSIPAGLYGTATANWDGSQNCGRCVEVNHGGKLITAMIVDECPNCGTNHLDLFPDAFAALDDPVKGIIDVSWDYVECPMTSPIQLRAKDGASQWWFSMQVINANSQVSRLEVSADGGNSWRAATRQSYNFFELSGGTGSSIVTVRLTSGMGDTLTIEDVDVNSDAITEACRNFN